MKKKLALLLSGLFLLMLFPVWGQTASITITNSSIGGSAVLGSNNYNSGAERTWTQGSVDFGGKAITCNPSNTPTGASACQYIQAQANNGVIYNTSALPGRLVSVEVIGTANVPSSCFGGTSRLINTTAANYTVTGGTQIGAAQNGSYIWTTSPSDNYTFFCIKRGGTAQYFSSIIITYETGFTVTFDANGGTGSMSPQTASVPTNLTSNTFTRSGFVFAGWNTLANGSGTAYANGASFPFSANATLYAQWTPSGSPTLTATALTAFGNQCIGGSYGPNAFTITGSSLTTANVTVASLAGYTFSTTSGGTYTSSLSLPQGGGAFSQQIFVKFEPTAVISYNGNIVVGGGGATDINVVASGAGINTGISITTPTSASVGVTTATLGGNITSIGCSNATVRGVEWSTSNGFANGTGTQVSTSGSFGTGVFTQAVTGLPGGTLIYYKAFATNSAGTVYTSQASFTTLKPEPTNFPTAFACGTSSGSLINLNWNDASGASLPDAYLIKWSSVSFAAITDPVDGSTANGTESVTVNQGIETVAISGLSPASTYYFKIWPFTNTGANINYKVGIQPQTTCNTAMPCSDLLISEYVEGSGNNKYIEIYNPTSGSINLSDYSLILYANGTSTPANTSPLSGTLAPNAVVVYQNAGASLSYPSLTAMNFNGDDAIVLSKLGVPVDIFGRVGEDPGTAWTGGGNSTLDKTLRRKFGVEFPVGTNPGSGFPTLGTEWDQFNIDDFSGLGSHASICGCSVPDKLEFVSQPSDVTQNANMGSFQVKAICSSTGATAAGFTGNITVSVLEPGCGMNDVTVSAVNGIATFNSVSFLRSPQTALQLEAFSSGLVGDTSATFNVLEPIGVPINTSLKNENFSVSAPIPWNYIVGTPTTVGSGGSGGTDFVGIKTFAGNDVLAKSYSANNGSNERGSQNTVTFDNVTGLSGYDFVTLKFQVASLSSGGSGGGNDSGEDMLLEISTNAGLSWVPILNVDGQSNRLFSLSSSPVTQLNTANITNNASGSQSAYSLQMNGISQLSFRYTATNNRTNENWVIDNITLVGTQIPLGVPFNLPTADAGIDLEICPGGSAQLSAGIQSFQAPASYSWSPSGSLSSAVIANPIASPSANQTYTVVITDAHNCKDQDQVDVEIPGLVGVAGLWTGAEDRDWFNCKNWSNGIIPDISTDVLVPVTTHDPEITQASALTRNLTIQNGALIEINDAGSSVFCYGNLTISGDFIHTDGSFSFMGASNATITGSTPSFFNLTLNKSAALILDTDIQIVNELSMVQGNIQTQTNSIELGVSTSEKGVLNYTDGHVIGIMKRWFNGTNTGNASGLFPIGVSGADRFATVEYGTAPSAGGSLTARFVSSAMGLSGLPITGIAGTCATFDASTTADEGYWQIDDADGLSGGDYDITLVGEGISTITDLCQVTALKRVGGGNWIENGTHTDPTGTIGRPIVKRTGANGWSNWGFGGSPVNPLPVVMGSFTADCEADGILLNWVTLSELNSARFVIEQSIDLIHFDYVDMVSAAGNSNEPIAYEYKLNRPNQSLTQYFRLKQEDFDGAFEYFGPVAVSCQEQQAITIVVQGSQLNIGGLSANNEALTLKIFDLNGKELRKEIIPSYGNLVSSIVDISTFNSGIYFIHLTSSTFSHTQKIVVTH